MPDDAVPRPERYGRRGRHWGQQLQLLRELCRWARFFGILAIVGVSDDDRRGGGTARMIADAHRRRVQWLLLIVGAVWCVLFAVFVGASLATGGGDSVEKMIEAHAAQRPPVGPVPPDLAGMAPGRDTA